MISGLCGINLIATADAHVEQKKELESKGELRYLNRLKAVKFFKDSRKIGRRKRQKHQEIVTPHKIYSIFQITTLCPFIHISDVESNYTDNKSFPVFP